MALPPPRRLGPAVASQPLVVREVTTTTASTGRQQGARTTTSTSTSTTSTGYGSASASASSASSASGGGRATGGGSSATAWNNTDTHLTTASSASSSSLMSPSHTVANGSDMLGDNASERKAFDELRRAALFRAQKSPVDTKSIRVLEANIKAWEHAFKQGLGRRPTKDEAQFDGMSPLYRQYRRLNRSDSAMPRADSAASGVVNAGSSTYGGHSNPEMTTTGSLKPVRRNLDAELGTKPEERSYEADPSRKRNRLTSLLFGSAGTKKDKAKEAASSLEITAEPGERPQKRLRSVAEPQRAETADAPAVVPRRGRLRSLMEDRVDPSKKEAAERVVEPVDSTIHPLFTVGGALPNESGQGPLADAPKPLRSSPRRARANARTDSSAIFASPVAPSGVLDSIASDLFPDVSKNLFVPSTRSSASPKSPRSVRRMRNALRHNNSYSDLLARRAEVDVVGEADTFSSIAEEKLRELGNRKASVATSQEPVLVNQAPDQSGSAPAESYTFRVLQQGPTGKYENFTAIQKSRGNKGLSRQKMSAKGRAAYRRHERGKDPLFATQNSPLETKSLFFPLADELLDATTVGTDPFSHIRDNIENDPGFLRARLQHTFGFADFRHSQEDVVRRVLARQHTLFISPTGSGKSLPFQFVACLLNPGQVVLVISPLISLMQDQQEQLARVSGGKIRSALLSPSTYPALLDEISQGRGSAGEIPKILFCSPELLQSQRFIDKFRLLNLSRSVGLVVADEAHCVAEWSHNFRWAYLRVRHVLNSQLGIPLTSSDGEILGVPFLALTATATKDVERQIVATLKMATQGGDSVVLRSSFGVRKSCDVSTHIYHLTDQEARIRVLLRVLKTEPLFMDPNLVVIYVLFREQATRVSQVLRDHGIPARQYHGDMTDTERSRTQKAFLESSNQVLLGHELTGPRVIVATVAFGLGVDIPNIRAVIHFDMPRSLENYVQEIGRAGRDESPCASAVFLDEASFFRLQSLCYKDSVDDSVVHTLLTKYLSPSLAHDSESSLSGSGGYVRPFQVRDFAASLDIPQSTVETLLTSLESGGYLKLWPSFDSILEVAPASVDEDIETDFTDLLNLLRDRCDEPLSLVDCLESLVLSPRYADMSFVSQDIIPQLIHGLDDALQELQAKGLLETFEFHNPVPWVVILKPPPENIYDELLKPMEVATVTRLRKCWDVLFRGIGSSRDTIDQHNRLDSYFLRDTVDDNEDLEYPRPSAADAQRWEEDLVVFVKRHASTGRLSGARSVARILHGLESPRFPRVEWQAEKLWGRLQEAVDFEELRRRAVDVLVHNYPLSLRPPLPKIAQVSQREDGAHESRSQPAPISKADSLKQHPKTASEQSFPGRGGNKSAKSKEGGTRESSSAARESRSQMAPISKTDSAKQAPKKTSEKTKPGRVDNTTESNEVTTRESISPAQHAENPAAADKSSKVAIASEVFSPSSRTRALSKRPLSAAHSWSKPDADSLETCCDSCSAPKKSVSSDGRHCGKQLFSCGSCHSTQCRSCWQNAGTMFFEDTPFRCVGCGASNKRGGRNSKRGPS